MDSKEYQFFMGLSADEKEEIHRILRIFRVGSVDTISKQSERKKRHFWDCFRLLVRSRYPDSFKEL
jgi:hypothetical protein